MDIAKLISVVVESISAEPSIEGAFLCESSPGSDAGESPDISIGIVSKGTVKDFRKAFGLHGEILHAFGEPIHVVETEWEHCRKVGALYGKSQYPPIGLKVELVFSQAKHVAEQVQQNGSRVIFDRSGTLAPQIGLCTPRKSKDEIEQELKQHLSSYPFYLHEAVQAFGSKDRANAHSVTELMRKAIYYTAAVRAGGYAQGSKCGLTYLQPGEKWVLEHSYQTVTRKTLEKLTDLYVACLTEVQMEYQIAEDVEQFKQSLAELL